MGKQRTLWAGNGGELQFFPFSGRQPSEKWRQKWGPGRDPGGFVWLVVLAVPYVPVSVALRPNNREKSANWEKIRKQCAGKTLKFGVSCRLRGSTSRQITGNFAQHIREIPAKNRE